jgi:hypothetical protein
MVAPAGSHREHACASAYVCDILALGLNVGLLGAVGQLAHELLYVPMLHDQM